MVETITNKLAISLSLSLSTYIYIYINRPNTLVKRLTSYELKKFNSMVFGKIYLKGKNTDRLNVKYRKEYNWQIPIKRNLV